MNTPTITEELEWCEIELANIKAGLFSMYTQEYIEGAISALRLAKEGDNEYGNDQRLHLRSVR
jgi:hypothetical protein